MAKRSRKARSKKTQQPAVRPRAQAAATTAKPSVAQSTVDFVKDYYYVYDDMRTMLFLTVLMVLVMLGLSFVF